MKKTLRSAVSVILSLLIVFSAAFSATAVSLESEGVDEAALLAKAMKYCEELDEIEKTEDTECLKTQSVASFNYLVEYLIEDGQYDSYSDIYYIFGSVTQNGMYAEFMIYYNPSYEKVYFFSNMLEDKLYLYMAVSASDTDSYEARSYATQVDYTMYGTVYPRSYPHNISFTGEPNIYIGYDGAALWSQLSSNTFQMTVPFWSALLERDTPLNLGNFEFVRLFTPKPEPAKKTYTVSFDMNGGTGNIPSQTKEKKVDLVLTNYVPVKYGYKFLGWSTDKNATAPEYTSGGRYTADCNTTLYAVWEKDYSVKIYDSSVKILNNPKTVALNFKTLVYLSAEAYDMPEGAYIKWFVNGQDTGISENNYSFEGTSTVEIAVKAFDKDGDVMRDVNGKEIADTEKVIVNSGFFHRLIQAIRRLLFGVTEYHQ